MSTLLCIGFGYAARAIAERAARRGMAIIGTARRVEDLAPITAAGHGGVVFDGLEPSDALAAAIAEASHIVVSVPPASRSPQAVIGVATPQADAVLALHGADIAVAPRLRWIGYLSTVGVYGDRQGGWVDESTPLRPDNARSRRRLAAETAWAGIGAARATPVALLRIAGIYGPGRSAFDALGAGTAKRIVKPGQVFNRIHVDDIAAICDAAMRQRAGGPINLCDLEPAPPQDVVAEAARLLGVSAPPETAYEIAALSPMAREFYSECKRVRSLRVREELGVTLSHPTYRHGLTAIRASE